jgi:lysophospholipase L1-like esterase
VTNRINFRPVIRLAVTIVLCAAAIVLAHLVALPGPALVALGVVSGGLLLKQSVGREESSRYSRRLLALVALGSLPALWHLGLGSHAWDHYYGLIAGLIASAGWLAAPPAPTPVPLRSWRALSFGWAFAGSAILIGTAYFRNQTPFFWVTLLVAGGLLIAVKKFLRLPAAGIQVANTLLIMLPGLCVADFFLFPAAHLQVIPSPVTRPYSYETFSRDPGAYARWWRYYQQQLGVMYRTICVPDPNGQVQFLLRSNVPVRLCDNRFAMNNFGFRGRDIQTRKGNTYRIVALGESTTFGITVAKDGRPWPEWLETIIRDQLQPDRPVEVINAGVPSFTLAENLHRLRTQILPLQPDLIISYHGYNEFGNLDAALPPVRSRVPPPRFPQRPLKLLATAEYRLQLIKYARLLAPQATLNAPRPTDPLQTKYADHYRELIQLCRRSGVRLVLATYSMAVNEASAKDVRAFYHRISPLLKRKMKANVAHTRLVQELARQNPDVCLVDTQPALDGQNDYYIDLMHFTPEGKELLAETIFSGIKDTLAQELAKPL